MKAIILARVSTEEQKIEGQSIPAQLARAREYANKKEFKIKSEHQFDESSTKDKRKKFEQVIDEIKKSKEKIALVVETVDRLQRGFKESVQLDDFRKKDKLEIHFIRENLVIHKDSNSSEIQRWDLAVFVAKSFVLQISDNVKRTIGYKLNNGEWISQAPIGYINTEDINGNKDVVPDPARSHFITKVFEMYATGNYSIRQTQKEIVELGLKTHSKTPKAPTVSTIEYIIKNPFYYGEMQSKGKLYPHKYQQLIPKELWDKAQEVRLGYHKKPFKYGAKPYIFRGLIKCADCGCTITPDTSKGHIYYSCTNYKKMHDKRIYVKENELLEPVYKIFNNIKLSNEKIEEITEELRKSNQSKNQFLKTTINELREEHDKYEKRISAMADERFDGSITKDFFDQKLKEYKEKQAELIEKMSRHDKADENYYITVNTVLNLAQRASEVFESSEPDEKRQLLNFLLQNFQLKERKLFFQPKTPLNTVLLAKQHSNCSDWLPIQNPNKLFKLYSQI
jgi:site-specific DNA recombinase